jgi:bla regulator protein BlaR1
MTSAGDLFLKKLVFLPGGKMDSSLDTWTKGVVLNSRQKTASRYEIRSIGGKDYMFYEWKSGDYTVRHMKPQYYVLVRADSR